MGKIGAGDVANAAFGAALGGGLGAVLGGHLGKKAVGEDGLKNAKVIEAHEGETFSCDVKADLRGMPKVTWMQDKKEKNKKKEEFLCGNTAWEFFFLIF